MAPAQTITFDALRRQLANRQYAPVYLLHGEEGYYIDALVKEFEKIIPDEDKAILEGAIQCSGWNNIRGDGISRMYFDALAKKYKFKLTTPWKNLTKEVREIILYGTKGENLELHYDQPRGKGTLHQPFEGICNNIERRYRDTQSEASRRELEYLLAVWFVTGILFPLLRHFWPFQLVTQINTWYRMNMAYSAVGFAALGHYVRQYGGTIPLGWYRISLAAGLGITFGGCAVLSLRDGALNELFLEGMSPGPALMAFGLFGLILFGRDLPDWAARPVARLAQASFCIYLCHILFQRWFLRLGLSGGASPCVLAVPGMAVLLAVCGWLAWEVLRRVPVVKSYLI